MIVRELVTKLGFDSDQTKVDKFDASVNSLKVGLIAASAAMAALAGGLFVAIRGFAEGADTIAKNARAAGLAGETYQELALVAGDAGVAMGEFDSSVRIFSRNIGEARRGAGTAKDALEELGISLTKTNGQAKTNEEVFNEVAAGIARVEDQAIQASLAQAIFGRSGQRMTLLLDQGTDEINRQRLAMRAMGRVIEEEALANSEEFGDRLEDVTGILKGLKNEVLAEFLPLAIEIAVAIKEWALANGELIRTRLRDFINGVIRGARFLISIIGGAISVVDQIAQAMGGWESVLSLVTSAIITLVALRFPAWILATASAVKVLSLALLANPVAATITAIALAVIFVVDEIRNWVAGNDTLIGRILGPWEDFRDTMVAIFDRVKAAIQSVASFVPSLPEIPRNEEGGFSLSGTADRVFRTLASPIAAGADFVRTQIGINNTITVEVPAGAGAEDQARLTSEAIRRELARQANDAIVMGVATP